MNKVITEHQNGQSEVSKSIIMVQNLIAILREGGGMMACSESLELNGDHNRANTLILSTHILTYYEGQLNFNSHVLTHYEGQLTFLHMK